MRKSWIFIIIILLLCALGFYILNGDQKKTTSKLAVVDEMYELISSNSVYKTTEKALVEGALRGMAEAIQDPYSTYYSEQQAAIHNQSLAEQKIGIGVELAQSFGKILVVSPVKSSPAEKAGIRPFDEIVQIDGEPVSGRTMAEVMQLMYGNDGEEVTLTIFRPQLAQHIDVKVKRAVLQNDTVRSEIIEQEDVKIGYIAISLFAENTSKEWLEALQSLMQSKPQALLIDVRDNPGGYLHAVAQIMSSFHANGKIFAYMQDEQGAVEPLKTIESTDLQPFEQFLQSVPIAILQNEGSASASEVMTAALQSWGRAALVGTKSFGKGTVQETWSLQNKGELKLSTNRWLTPKQQWIHGQGVIPHIEVEQHPLFSVQLMPYVGTFVEGDLNEQVAYVQKILHDLGYQVTRQDGFFDEETADAMQTFRKQHDLHDGQELDEALFTEIQKQLLAFREDAKNDEQKQMAIQYLLHEIQ